MADGTHVIKLEVIADTALANTGLKNVAAQAQEIDKAFEKFAVGGILGGVTLQALKLWVDNAAEAQKSDIELADSFARVGAAAGVTKDQVAAMATEIQSVSRFSDEAVKDAASRLLLFTNVTGETFTTALRMSADLAARMGTDVPAAAEMLGRALQSPGQGLRGLVQVGVRFNEEQTKTLQRMVEVGRGAEAQAIIIEELGKRTKGAAEDSIKPFSGALEQLKNSFGELFENNGGMDKATKVVNLLSDAAKWFGQDEGMAKWIKAVGRAASDALNPVGALSSRLLDLVDTGKDTQAGEGGTAKGTINGRSFLTPPRDNVASPTGVARGVINGRAFDAPTSSPTSSGIDSLASIAKELPLTKEQQKSKSDTFASLSGMFEKEQYAYQANLDKIAKLNEEHTLNDAEALKAREMARKQHVLALGELQRQADDALKPIDLDGIRLQYEQYYRGLEDLVGTAGERAEVDRNKRISAIYTLEAHGMDEILRLTKESNEALRLSDEQAAEQRIKVHADAIDRRIALDESVLGKDDPTVAAKLEVAAYEDKVRAIAEIQDLEQQKNQARLDQGLASREEFEARSVKIAEQGAERRRVLNDEVLKEFQVTSQYTAQVMDRGVQMFTDSVKDAFKNVVRTGEFSMKGLVTSIIAALLQKRLYDAIDKFGTALSDAMSAKGSGSGGGGFLQSLVHVFTGDAVVPKVPSTGKAGGGYIKSPTLVGENGPEVVVPGTMGMAVLNADSLRLTKDAPEGEPVTAPRIVGRDGPEMVTPDVRGATVLNERQVAFLTGITDGRHGDDEGIVPARGGPDPRTVNNVVHADFSKGAMVDRRVNNSSTVNNVVHGDFGRGAAPGKGLGEVTVFDLVGKAFFGKAGGGYIDSPTIVGENGPEVAIPGTMGATILNQRQLSFAGASMGGGGSVTYAPKTVFNVQGDVDQRTKGEILSYVESTRRQDQKGMLEMLYRNGFGRMR